MRGLKININDLLTEQVQVASYQTGKGRNIKKFTMNTSTYEKTKKVFKKIKKKY